MKVKDYKNRCYNSFYQFNVIWYIPVMKSSLHRYRSRTVLLKISEKVHKKPLSNSFGWKKSMLISKSIIFWKFHLEYHSNSSDLISLILFIKVLWSAVPMWWASLAFPLSKKECRDYWFVACFICSHDVMVVHKYLQEQSLNSIMNCSDRD